MFDPLIGWDNQFYGKIMLWLKNEITAVMFKGKHYRSPSCHIYQCFAVWIEMKNSHLSSRLLQMMSCCVYSSYTRPELCTSCFERTNILHVIEQTVMKSTLINLLGTPQLRDTDMNIRPVHSFRHVWLPAEKQLFLPAILTPWHVLFRIKPSRSQSHLFVSKPQFLRDDNKFTADGEKFTINSQWVFACRAE